MIYAPSYLAYDWSPLLDALAIPILVALLYVGRASVGAAARVVAVGATISVVAYLALVAVALQGLEGRLYGPNANNEGSSVALLAGTRAMVTISYVLTFVAFGLIFFAAIQARRWRWLSIFAVVAAIAFAMPGALLTDLPVFSLIARYDVTNNVTFGEVLALAVAHIGVLAALVGALLLPRTAHDATNV